jgi:nitronate monooxygenase
MDLLSYMKFPIIQGPMAGGASTPELIAAVSNAGALGSLAASLLAPEAMREQVGRIRALTSQPFQINLFVLQTPSPSEQEVADAIERLRPAWEAAGMTSLPVPAKWCEDFNAQFAALLELRPPVASFTFGILSAAQVQQLHDAGIAVIGTITTVDEAVAWQQIGADAVVASGIECGGHRGTFLGPQEDATLTGHELWPLVAAAVDIPVIAAGAIMTGADIRSALNMGAAVVQMGTAFLVCEESGIGDLYREKLLNAGNTPTRLTRSFSGRYARGLENEFIRQMKPVELEVPAYPVQNALTTAIRAAAAKQGNAELMSLWAGTGVARARPMKAAQLVSTLVSEMQGFNSVQNK